MSTEQETVTLTAHCLCKRNTFTTQVARSELPLTATACHCDSCRYVSGALYTCDAPWPEPRSKADVSQLRVYHFSPKVDLLFCGTCSSLMFWASPEPGEEELGVFTGVIQNGPGDLVKFKHHIFVGDTKDGGATMWMRKLNADGTEARRYKERSRGEVVEYPFDWPPSSSLTGFEAKKEASIAIRCRCKGVDLVWHRGSYKDTKKEDLPFFIDPTTYKSLASICACDSCRLFGGIDLWTWTFAELKNLTFADGTPIPKMSTDLKPLVDKKDPKIGTLTYYESSPDVQRYFCSTCSASIFYAADDRPNLMDVAVGVLRAPDGARAEDFLSWSFGAVGRIEDTEGGWRHDLLERVIKESEEWRIARGYPKNWRRAMREDGKEFY